MIGKRQRLRVMSSGMWRVQRIRRNSGSNWSSFWSAALIGIMGADGERVEALLFFFCMCWEEARNKTIRRPPDCRRPMSLMSSFQNRDVDLCQRVGCQVKLQLDS